MEGETFVSEDEIFSRSGPYHLTDIDWTNPYHRTSVASSLVKGVYTMEQDRQKNWIGTPESQAETWWKYFHFSLHKCFFEESNGSITAAIFEYNYKDNNPLGIHPHYVVAFRGTMTKRETWLRDVLLDIRGSYNLLHGENMINIINEIKTMVSKHGNKTIWLAGHSLGASMALYAGKTMARSGYPLEAYIFNPLTALTSLKVFKINILKFVVRVAGTIIRASIVKATGHDKGEEAESFMKLAVWRPYLYVNPMDPICSEYINYFKDGNKMSEMGLPVSLGTRYTNINPFSGGGGGGERGMSSQPLHILPSAYLMTNTTISPKRPRAHGIVKDMRERMRLEKGFIAHQIRQWWDPESMVKCELFQLNDSALHASSYE